MENVFDMPTADDLRAIARAAFEELRGARPATGRGAMNDLAFAQRELVALGRGEVYDAEFRRSELILRGFVPPDDSETP
jgi:hypothetical protein